MAEKDRGILGEGQQPLYIGRFLRNFRKNAGAGRWSRLAEASGQGTKALIATKKIPNVTVKMHVA